MDSENEEFSGTMRLVCSLFATEGQYNMYILCFLIFFVRFSFIGCSIFVVVVVLKHNFGFFILYQSLS